MTQNVPAAPALPPRSGTPPRLIGVVHLAPLPGSPRAADSLGEIIRRAVQDARAYYEGGADAVIVENFGDAPFFADRVEPHTIAAMTLAARAVIAAVPLPVGINVLRNDAAAALGIAAMTGAAFIRVNIHTGVMVTDQGIIEGRAAETLRYRRTLGAQVEIWADVLVKHGVPLGPQAIEDAARDAVERGLADAVIVTGSATGLATDPTDVVRVRRVLPETPVYVGSGASPETIPAFLPAASGVIVGTWAKRDGEVHRPVDPARVERLARALRGT
ncbi:MAG: BtpA/SgcQ family protein [Sphaerobacter sp.]|nr:BtpA/SgcQ family protein [Sphaerobacter sp.]